MTDVEAGVEAALQAALRELAAAGVADPPVVLAVGDDCAARLAAFVLRCRDGDARVRVRDSLGMEGSRLLAAAARSADGGVAGFVVATAGEGGWRQACRWSVAALTAREADGAVVCGVRDGVACSLAVRRAGPPGPARPDAPLSGPFVAAFEDELRRCARRWQPTAVRRGAAFACRVPCDDRSAGGPA